MTACLSALSLFALASHFVYSQEEIVRSIPNGIVLTASGTLQAAQGELQLFVGDRADVAPKLFRPNAQGGMDFSVDFGDHVYQFHAAEVVVQTTSATVRVGVIDATAVAKPGAQSDAVFWCAWRHSPQETGGRGMFLSQKGALGETIDAPLPWQDNWTWFFNGDAYQRESQVLYFVRGIDGWARSAWVRPPQRAYAPLTQDSLTGYMRLSRKLLPNQSASVRIYVPFMPLGPMVWGEIQTVRF